MLAVSNKVASGQMVAVMVPSQITVVGAVLSILNDYERTICVYYCILVSMSERAVKFCCNRIYIF